MSSDGETGAAALARKLAHPLGKIRARALQRLLSKLCARLLAPAALEAQAAALAPRLLAALREPALEPDALRVLELLVEADSAALLAALQDAGAVAELQRAAIDKAPEVEAAYEKLLQKLLVTPHAASQESIQANPRREQIERSSQQQVDNATAPRRQLSDSQAKRMQQWTRTLPELEARGWRFAPVQLSATDDQFLFEFEVKLTLRTTAEDMVAMCRTISRKLLRDFPPEIFLQRPAVLEYLLHLVRQPLLPTTAIITGNEDVASELSLDQAMEVSLGVNYFDAVGSSTYSSKRGNLTGAVLMSAITAIESLIAALNQATIDATDPTLVIDEYTVPAPANHFPDSYDHRRHYYPRSAVNARGNRAQLNRHEDDEIGYSLSGAVYKIVMSLLPLVRIKTHPRLHILNILHTCVHHLAEKEVNNAAASDEISPLDKQRVETILYVLSDVCRPISADGEDSNQRPLSVQWRCLELAIQLLQLHPEQMYTVSANVTQLPVDIQHDPRILIPAELWHTIKTWFSSPISLRVPDVDCNRDNVVKILSNLDSSIPSFLQLKQTARQDCNEMESFVASAKHCSSFAFSEWPLSSRFTCQNALKVLNASTVWKRRDTPAIGSGIAFAVWRALEECNDSSLNLDLMRCIVSRSINLSIKSSDETSSAIATDFFAKMSAVFDNDPDGSKSRTNFITLVVANRPVLSHLLWALLALENESSSEVPNEQLVSLWRLVGLFAQECEHLQEDQLADLRTLIPSLQLLAYHEPASTLDQKSSSTRFARSCLAQLLNRLESHASVCERLLLISRCLLHTSPILRVSAASGVRRVLTRDLQVSMSKLGEDSRDDPFTSLEDPVIDANTSWEAKLVELALPSDGPDNDCHNPSRRHNLSERTRKLAQLYEIVRTTTLHVQQSALKELNLLIETIPHGTMQVLEELEETAKIFQLCHDVVAGHVSQESSKEQHSLYPSVIRLLRNLLFRSEALRIKARSSADFLRDVLPLIFDSQLDVRVYMYYVVLLLTCSSESLIEHNLDILMRRPTPTQQPVVPELVSRTFGLYASRWSRCGIPILRDQMIVKTLLEEQSQGDSNWLQSIEAIINSRAVFPAVDDEKDARNTTSRSNNATLTLPPEYDFIVSKLRGAPSHGKFLNAVYHLSELCHASRASRQKLAQEWESIFERYLTVEPKSLRDEVIVGAVLHIIAAFTCEMSRSDQLRLVLVSKRAFLPLLQRSKTTFFPQELARLLLHLSRSQVADLFPSLVADTEIVSIVCTTFSMYSTDPVLHAVMLQLFEMLVLSVGRQRVAVEAPFHNIIRQRIVEMVSPLFTIVSRHRMPGSFLDHDVFCTAVRGIVSVLRTISHKELTSGNSSVQHSDAAFILDGSWCSRLIFHHSSAVRAVGFSILADFADSDVQLRMLEMAAGTASDATESDAVRSQACKVVTTVLLHFSSLSNAQKAQATAVLAHGEAIVLSTSKQLVGALKSEKILVQSCGAYTRLLLVLLSNKAALAERLGSITDALLTANQEHDLFPELVKALDIAAWSEKNRIYASNSMLLRDGNQLTWQQTVLPNALELIIDLCKLLQGSIAEFGESHTQFLRSHTPLIYALMDLINRLNDSLTVSQQRLPLANKTYFGVNSDLAGLHYDALLEAGKTLGLLLEKFDMIKSSEEAMGDIERQLGNALAELMDVKHPTTFRLGFTGVITGTIVSYPQLASLAIDAAKTLTSSVFDIFAEISDSSLSDAELSASSISLWRVANTLQALLEANVASRRVVEAKRGLELCLTAIKTLFVTLRAEGGFGSTKRHASAHNRPMVICSRISAHMNVLSALAGGDAEMQGLAKGQYLPSVLVSNWSVMKAAHIRGSPVFLSALTLLESYSYGNDETKASLAFIQPLANSSTSTGGEEKCILLLLCDLVLHRNPANLRSQPRSTEADLRGAPLRLAACDILSGAVLNSECCKTMIKFGAVGKIVAEVQERLKLAAQTRRAAENRAESELLGRMLRVLAALASGEEGANSIYTSSTNGLTIILQDVLQSSDLKTQAFGYLLVRNLALVDVSKVHSVVWEDLLPFIVEACVRNSQEAIPPIQHPAIEFLADALWSLVFDNQKLKATLLGRPVLLRSLDSAASRSPSPAAAGSLLRALQLIRS